MPSILSTPTSKMVRRVFANRRLRHTIDKEKPGHLEPANKLAGHDHLDIPAPSKTLPISMVRMSTHADLTTARLDTSPGLSNSTSSSDDSVHQVHNNQNVSLFSHARDVAVNGGTFYAVGGNLTVQGLEPREIAGMFEDVRETLVQTIDRRLQEMIGGRSQLPPVISTGFLYVMDATGRRHTLTMDMAHSLEQFNAALRVLFLPERPQNRVLQKYMDIGAFVLTIDDGREHMQLTDQEGWTSTIRGGMTVVMSVIMTQQGNKRSPKKYQCPFCDCWNKLKGNNGKSSIDCGSCERRFQFRPTDRRDIDKTETRRVSNNERNLIQNIYLTQGRMEYRYNYDPYRYQDPPNNRPSDWSLIPTYDTDSDSGNSDSEEDLDSFAPPS